MLVLKSIAVGLVGAAILYAFTGNPAPSVGTFIAVTGGFYFSSRKSNA